MSVCSHLPTVCSGDYPSISLALDERLVSGTMPSELGALTVVDLNLRLNVLSGTVPAALWQLTSLTNNLQLWENRISGTIATEVSRLSRLKGLYLEVNSLSGTIPTELALLSSSLTHNLGLCCNCGRHWEMPCEPNAAGGVSGTIPTEFGYLSKIGYLSGERDLDLGLNRLSGTVPTELGQLTHATNLWMQQNRLSGTMPTELHALSKLQVLALEGNLFSGTIPPLTSLRLLTYCSLNSLAAPVCPAVGQRLPPACYDHVLPEGCSTPPKASVVPYVRERVLSPVVQAMLTLAVVVAVVRWLVRWFRRRDSGGSGALV